MIAASPGIAGIVLLALAAAISALASLAVLLMSGFYDKLHYLAPPAVIGLSAVVLAIVIEEGFSTPGIKALMVLVIVIISNPVVTNAAARAKLMRDQRKESHKG